MAAPRKKRRAPRLLRLSNGLHTAAFVVFLVFIIYLGTVAYSATRINFNTPNSNNNGNGNNGSSGNGGGFNFEFQGASTVVGSTTVNITNGGFYSITNMELATATTLSGGPRVGSSSTSIGTVGAGAEVHVPITVMISVAPGSPGQALLTNSGAINVTGWVNATFGYVITAAISFANNNSWGAPFDGAAVSITQSAGEANVTLTFSNQASFPVAGDLAFVIHDPSGAACGSGSFVVDVGAGSPFAQTAQVPTACAGVAGGLFSSTLSGPPGSYTIVLPELTEGAGP